MEAQTFSSPRLLWHGAGGIASTVCADACSFFNVAYDSTLALPSL